MLICNDCEKTFEEPKTIMTTYEKYYGVGDQFGNHHSLELYCCPYCKSEDFEDYEEEKEKYKNEIETCGGFLKTLEYKEAFRLAWDKASKEEHLKLLDLPNWDNEIFKEISGIDAEAEIEKE